MTESAITTVNAGVTAPRGFLAGSAAAGLRTLSSNDDLALLFSEAPCVAAGLFTSSALRAAPVLLSQRNLADGKAQAVIANAGCANAYTGAEGLRDSEEMAHLAASRLRVADGDVLVASTGVTGHLLPMDKIRDALPSIALDRDGGERFARAIMTTDTVPKQAAATFTAGGREYRVGGCAKGSGMIHPNMATMLAFLTTDAPVEQAFLEKTLRRAAEVSFEMITVDGDSSPSDTIVILANGAAGGPALGEGVEGATQFREAVAQVCIELAKGMARDGEGATKLIEVKVSGAKSVADARAAARTVAGSPLVKSAVYGNDPNWGRVLAAVARSGAEAEESATSLFWQGVCVFQKGRMLSYDEEALSAATKSDEVRIRVDLGLGNGRAVAWGCDLTEEYVRINSEYTT
ncbi:MAG TPA: bifunctional glutamate N-acetyltransferase/amino-acid acetyltransferase ArgJ [Dehalococcoidia bacterium]|nr:bifunctional glutamate N-acetyltransferase/amino-acid acetyltransferase ArgJ [Dehalococcoidia bacterium]